MVRPPASRRRARPERTGGTRAFGAVSFRDMIQVEHHTKLFGKVPAVADVSFQVPEGRILGFLGPNGAGKSTTMRILTGYLPATSGTARCAGFDVFTQSLEVRRRLGYLPERVPLYREMRVREYLQFVAAVKGLGRRARAAQVDEVMRLTAIADIPGRIIGNLSRGYHQRVGLAQALLGDPPILILDEPTVGLDPAQIVEIRELIRSFKGQRTVILSTHILPEVSAVCDDVAIIHEGRIVIQDSLEHLEATQRGLGHVRVQVAGPADDVEGALRQVGGVESVARSPAADGDPPAWDVHLRGDTDARPAIAQAVVRGGWDLLQLHSVQRSLEDIFLETVTGARTGESSGQSVAEEAGA